MSLWATVYTQATAKLCPTQVLRETEGAAPWSARNALPFMAIAWAASALAAMALGSAAMAGPRVGNGGGAWLCRDTSSLEVRWVRLIDTFEAEAEWGLRLAPLPLSGIDRASIEATEARILSQLSKQSPELAALLDSHPFEFWSAAVWLPTSTSLTVIRDGFYRVKPSADTCPNGYVYFSQLANATDDGRVLINTALWDHATLTAVDRVALALHERVYHALRLRDGDKNSLRTRRIVGLLLSDMQESDQRDAIAKTLLEPPVDWDESQINNFLRRVVCSARLETRSRDESLHLVRVGTRLYNRIEDIEFAATTDGVYGRPLELAVRDLRSGFGTTISGQQLDLLFAPSSTVSLHFTSARNNLTARLSCWLEAREF